MNQTRPSDSALREEALTVGFSEAATGQDLTVRERYPRAVR
ncbi:MULTISPECIES: hypothetical protein [Actinomyces]|nr:MULTISPECIES: hypothetical protein [Actinomyces]